MQNTTEIIRVILLFVSLIVMGVGVKADIKERIYPNSIVITTLLLGLVYGTVSGHLLESIIGFIIVNIIGLFFHKYNIMASGDMKYLSSLFLFVNIRDIQACLILIIYMFLITIIIGLSFYRKLGKKASEELKQELFAYKALALYKINTFKSTEFENKEEMLGKTLPFTFPMYLALILTILTKAILSVI